MTMTNPSLRDDSVRRKAEWVGWAIVGALMWALPFVGDAPVESEPTLDAIDAHREHVAPTYASHESDVF
jgi:hypothetical protein